jgi:hypothetical protein
MQFKNFISGSVLISAVGGGGMSCTNYIWPVFCRLVSCIICHFGSSPSLVSPAWRPINEPPYSSQVTKSFWKTDEYNMPTEGTYLYLCKKIEVQQSKHSFTAPRACICKPFKEPRNRFQAWQTVTTTLFVVPARQAT